MNVVRWSYGVTTVPQRLDDLLPRTLTSLALAGFDKPRLFVDAPNSTCEMCKKYQEFGLETVIRSSSVRTAGTWHLSLLELYVREPNADRYAIFQDDFVTYPNLRSYLERVEYPDKGYLNLLTFMDNERVIHGKDRGWVKSSLVRTSGPLELQSGRGALALVFNREAVVALLSLPAFVERHQDANRGWKRIDGGVVDSMNKMGFVEYVHNPSLVQHTGIVSSMRNSRHPQAKTFRGEEFNALAFLGQ